MKNKKWVHRTLILLISLSSSLAVREKLDTSIDTTNQTPQDKDIRPASNVKESRGLFSPRMDYEQWKPLGRGDPLKNDPTYDYVPPVLDRVHYWIDPSSRKPDPPIDSKKTEILVLGVSSKKPSVSYSVADSRRDQYDPYLQYVDGSNYNSYRIRRPEYEIPASYYPSPFYKLNNKEPYTMLVPPPMMESISYKPVPSTIPTTTSLPSSVSIEDGNLVYHSSSRPNWKGSNTYATIAEPSSQVTWRTPLNKTQLPQPSSFAIIQNIQPSMSVVMKPVSNIKNMETDIIVAPETMHKGEVSDDTLDLSSTYVNIGKPDAQVQSTTGMEAESLSTEPLTPPMKNAPIAFDYKKTENKPMTLQMTMETSTPPTMTQDFKKHSMLIHSLLKKEMTKPTPFLPTVSPTTIAPTTTSTSSLTTDPLFKHYKQPAEPIKGPLYLIIQGHSKVKTYGPSKQINGINIQETNEISTSEDRNLDPQFQVKHLHHEIKKEEWKREGRSHNLESLNQVVQSGFGSIEYDKDAEKRIDWFGDTQKAGRRIDYYEEDDEETDDDTRKTDRRDGTLETDRRYDTLENNRRDDTLETDRRDDALEAYRSGDALEADRRGDALKADRRGDALEVDRRGDVLEAYGSGAALESRRRGDALEADRRDDTLETDRRVDALETDRRVDALENDRRGDALEADRKGDALEADRRDDALETDIRDDALETDRRGDVLGADRRGDVAVADRRGYTLEAGRRGDALEADRRSILKADERFGTQESEREVQDQKKVGDAPRAGRRIKSGRRIDLEDQKRTTNLEDVKKLNTPEGQRRVDHFEGNNDTPEGKRRIDFGDEKMMDNLEGQYEQSKDDQRIENIKSVHPVEDERIDPVKAERRLDDTEVESSEVSTEVSTEVDKRKDTLGGDKRKETLGGDKRKDTLGDDKRKDTLGGDQRVDSMDSERRVDNIKERNNVKETELIVKYDVSSDVETTSEVYHKGIVESDNPPSRPSLYAIIFNKKN